MTPSRRAKRGLRLHPLSPVFQIGRSFFTLVVPGILFLAFASGDSYAAWYMLAFVPAVGTSLVRYFTLRYDLTPEHIVVREGLVFKSVRHIPYSRIQNIDTTQNPLHRLFGVAEVRLETAGGREPEAVFRVLSMPSLAVIQQGMLAWRSTQAGASHREPAAGGLNGEPAPFFRMKALDIALFGLLSQKGMALLAGLAYLIWEFDLWGKLQSQLPFDPEQASKEVSLLGWVLAALALFVVLQVLTIAWAFLTLFGFRIIRLRGGLSTYCGLWIKQSASLPRHRIHFLSVKEGILPRSLGRLSILAATAGGELEKEEQITRKWLIPLTRKDQLPAILHEVQPELDLEHVDWCPVHPKAYRRMCKRWLMICLLPALIVARESPLIGSALYLVLALVTLWSMRRRARVLAYSIAPAAILVRDGILGRERNAVRFSKIQSISVKQNPFDQRHGMASLEVDTAGHNSGGLRLKIPYLDLHIATELKDRLRGLSAGAAFRW